MHQGVEVTPIFFENVAPVVALALVTWTILAVNQAAYYAGWFHNRRKK